VALPCPAFCAGTMIDIHILRAAGLSNEQIIAVLETEQREKKLARREQNRKSQQNHRARKQKIDLSADSADTPSPCPPSSFPLDPLVITPLPPTPVSKPKRVSRLLQALPTDFALTESDKQHAFDNGWSPDKLTSELARFRDNATAKGIKYVDWHAAWRNWVTSPYQKPETVNGQRSFDMGANTRPQRPKTGDDAILAGMGRLAARLGHARKPDG
jgi:hypothetical protein